MLEITEYKVIAELRMNLLIAGHFEGVTSFEQAQYNKFVRAHQGPQPTLIYRVRSRKVILPMHVG